MMNSSKKGSEKYIFRQMMFPNPLTTLNVKTNLIGAGVRDSCGKSASRRCLERPSASQSTNHKKTVGKLDSLQVCLQSETATWAVFLFINDYCRSLMTYRQSRGITAVDG